MMTALSWLLVAAALCGVYASETIKTYGALSKAEVDIVFSKWQRQYGVSYKSAAERNHRLHIFRDNLEYVTAHNADPTKTSKLKMNRFGEFANE